MSSSILHDNGGEEAEAEAEESAVVCARSIDGCLEIGTGTAGSDQMKWSDRGRNDTRCSMLRARKSKEGEDGGNING